MKRTKYKNNKKIIIIFFILFVFILEVYFRVFFHDYFIKNPLPYLESDIEGVPYLQINFSDFELSKIKSRIIVLGDYISIHRSWENQTTYPEILDLKLNHSFEIINTGASFYSLPEEMSLLKNRAIDYDPDIIIMSYVFNDLDLKNPDNVIIPLKLKKEIYEFKIITPLSINYLIRLNVFKNISKLYEDKQKWMDYYANLHKDKKLINLLKDSLNELKQIKEEKGIEVIFVIIPIFYDFEDENINYINKVVYTECLKTELTCVNLLKIFKKYDVMEVKEDDGDIWHQNSLGNEIIATEIYKVIINKSKFFQ